MLSEMSPTPLPLSFMSKNQLLVSVFAQDRERRVVSRIPMAVVTEKAVRTEAIVPVL